MPGIEALDFLPDVCQRRVHFPAQAIVQGYGGLELPTVLREQVDGSAANQFRIGGTLRIRNGETEEVVGVGIGCAGVVDAAWPKNVFAVHVEIEFLIKFLVTEVTAKFVAMLADDLAEVVVELKGVARLRQLAFEVVAEKADRAIQSDVGNALQFGTESRVNAAAKARTDGRVGVSGRTQRIAA